ncbi:MAG TPA: hypothetical protein P5279_18020 [Anaerohalosphaeraceae bacterium]|jgi:hypothetical protein|nr:hypothetical protein [Anaerohalosphaeraceae bacterium]HRT52391.1 hypothetical protein [Anaerohalosphaeraceae bacterium]HRT88445.1 hypothetical protein [Anaerohalosphaeraceae bacterium]
MSELQGLKVNLIVTEPWDFTTAHGCGPFSAEVLQENMAARKRDELAILIRLDNPLVFEGERCEYFVATPRLETDDVANIAKSVIVHCNLTMIPEAHAVSSDPFDLSWWRGGLVLIGDFSIKG